MSRKQTMCETAGPRPPKASLRRPLTSNRLEFNFPNFHSASLRTIIIIVSLMVRGLVGELNSEDCVASTFSVAEAADPDGCPW